jgi:ribosomal protein RSM22 (predicted rRNA methylase)
LGYLGGLFPSAFGACKRVFEELVIRDKNFKPTKIMDFGTGPGTAIW